MSWACSTRTLLTTLPSGPVWGVIRVMPRIWSATCSTSSKVAADLDAPALAPAPGVDLGLDHKGAFGQFLRHLAGFPGGRGHVALGHRHVELLQQIFSLIFVNLHGISFLQKFLAAGCPILLGTSNKFRFSLLPVGERVRVRGRKFINRAH